MSVVSENTKTNTKTIHEADGSVTKIITTTVVKTYSDGRTSESTTTKTEKGAGNGSGGGCPIASSQPRMLSSGGPPKDLTPDTKTFVEDALKAHNDYRKLHGAPPLQLDANLCRVAQGWADNMAAKNSMFHSSCGLGENLYMAGGMKVTGKMATKAWYDEIKDYNFNNPGFKSGTGHFTQVIWKTSERFGIAFASRGSSTFVCANYDPPGNFQGRFPENVLRPQK